MRFEWDWFIGWTCATATVLGIITAIYFGTTEANQKYYASIDKCTAAGGSTIPVGHGEILCLMVGVNKQ